MQMQEQQRLEQQTWDQLQEQHTAALQSWNMQREKSAACATVQQPVATTVEHGRVQYQDVNTATQHWTQQQAATDSFASLLGFSSVEERVLMQQISEKKRRLEQNAQDAEQRKAAA